MKKLLISFRDYCYQELLVQKDREHAEESYQFLFGAALYGYYAVFLSIIAIIQWQLRILIPAIFKHNFLVIIITAVLMHMPFYFFIRWLLKQLSAIPLQREISRDRLVSWRGKAFLLYGLGLALMCLVPWGLTELLK
ncbi:MAG: hypothetical protein EOP45_12030 [Sphingobacteriaceae bacterium]|nr:MAG: hypothetical protein EOP45_12030 [Sphingobacteriaceae bacterium]